jgi:hypothetical protein
LATYRRNLLNSLWSQVCSAAAWPAGRHHTYCCQGSFPPVPLNFWNGFMHPLSIFRLPMVAPIVRTSRRTPRRFKRRASFSVETAFDGLVAPRRRRAVNTRSTRTCSGMPRLIRAISSIVSPHIDQYLQIRARVVGPQQTARRARRNGYRIRSVHRLAVLRSQPLQFLEPRLL